ncbi:hypothetical protein PR202_ga24961 [Eleusine coracana subsp. coracana]|uniref:WRKY domain-containing protein n=1 Tax=Eleusine coracana subsp. coracana TaxID=191504 RepID=A0AAV5D9E7_ELECO|nr:hypothetical protein QOZ80_9AG0672560 [Eleusine coracana subsp. coracana]GJN07157.1 hypothetical protein PR202_ga24961 [Eleusine coracana subsp. coracana]
MACLPDDLEGAVREVAEVYELIKTHQPLLLLSHLGQQEPPLAATKLAQSLLSEALRALNIALSVMNQQSQESSASPVAVKAEPQLSASSSATAAADSNGATTSPAARSGKRRRSVLTEGKNSSSWVNLTSVPYDDGYEWRKYGEKKINGTQFTRSYLRCTYKDDKGCLATKYIQQKDNSYPPVFQVTYNNEHTCNCTTASPAKKNNLSDTAMASSNPSIVHHDVMIKQEATVGLPPLADVSGAVPLDDQMPSQEPFPIADHYGTIGAGDMGLIMMESILMGDDTELQDIELRLLYNSFKYY